jgi:hypothetical protein
MSIGVGVAVGGVLEHRFRSEVDSATNCRTNQPASRADGGPKGCPFGHASKKSRRGVPGSGARRRHEEFIETADRGIAWQSDRHYRRWSALKPDTHASQGHVAVAPAAAPDAGTDPAAAAAASQYPARVAARDLGALIRCKYFHEVLLVVTSKNTGCIIAPGPSRR